MKKLIDDYKAVARAEGFEDATPEERIEAWGHLVKTGLAFSLQGWFGRTATDLINSGYLTREGDVIWERFYEDDYRN